MNQNYKTPSINWIRLFKWLGFAIVPLAATLGFHVSDKNWIQSFFFVGMLFHSFERVWETFYTTKEYKPEKLQGDWTLTWVTFFYIALCLLTIVECYFFPKPPKKIIFTLGILAYALAFRLRWWGMAALGKQWAIHAVGVKKIKKVRLIKLGPYKYIRHPIYLGIILELASIPLIANAIYSLGFVLLVNIPLQYVRLIEEEKSSLRRFGESYLNYKKEVSGLFPFNFFKKFST